jgi:hypothetical protein
MTGTPSSSYEGRIRQAIERGQPAEIETIAREAFGDTALEEGSFAWITAATYEKGLRAAPEFLQLFVKRCPASLHLPRVYLSNVLARAGRFDDATEHARRYLRQAKNAGVLANLGPARILREGVSRAFLLLTAAYTELGARSYSERVLKHALEFELVPNMIDSIKQELSRLAGEERAPANKAANEKWEAFLANGSGADVIYKLCVDRNCPILAKRVDLLEGNFRFNRQFIISEAEIFMLVDLTEGGAYVLS